MTDFFVVTKGPRGPIGQIYHDDPPKLDPKRGRLHSGDTLLAGPMEIPAYVAALRPSIDQLLRMWRKGVPRKKL